MDTNVFKLLRYSFTMLLTDIIENAKVRVASGLRRVADYLVPYSMDYREELSPQHLSPPDLTPYKEKWVAMCGLEVASSDEKLNCCLDVAKALKPGKEFTVFYVDKYWGDPNVVRIGL